MIISLSDYLLQVECFLKIRSNAKTRDSHSMIAQSIVMEKGGVGHAVTPPTPVREPLVQMIVLP
jgi:hypothetical protein